MKKSAYKPIIKNFEHIKFNRPLRTIISNRLKSSSIRTWVIAIGIILITPFTLKAEEIFAQLNKMPGVKSSYISGRYIDDDDDNILNLENDHFELGRGITALYSYVCTSEESMGKAQSILNQYLSKNPQMELVIRKEGYSVEYKVYEQTNKDDEPIKMIIWESTSNVVCTITVIYWKNGAKFD